MDSNAEAIIVGSELLLGMGVDTNGADIGRALLRLGCPLRWKTVVGDADRDLDDALARAARRSRVAVLSGGLGPTEDDRTRFALARLAGVELELRPELVGDIEAAFQRFKRPMGESNLVQARLPKGAEAIRNPLGTAPGFALEAEGCYLVALPGVPRELRHLLETWVVPRLRQRLGVRGLATRVLKLSGIGESRAGEQIADLMGPGRNPYVGILASPGEVRVFATAQADDDAAARRLLELPEALVRERLGRYLFGADEDTHAGVALRAAAAAGWSVGSLEGFTAGRLAAELRRTAESAFAGGQVLPASAARRLSAGAGDPSSAVLRLASVAAQTAGATAGLAVASEDELSDGAPGDSAWIGVSVPGRATARSIRLTGGGDADRDRTVHQALYELRALSRGV